MGAVAGGELAKVIMFLASDDASYLTGTTVVVGWGMVNPIDSLRS